MGRILALDYGDRRIGAALSDETNSIAFARPYIETNKKEILPDLIKENEVEKILIGLPKSLSGDENIAAEKARRFGSDLENETGVKVEYIDERFSTKAAVSELKQTGKKEKEIRTIVDSYVAQKMLEGYLNHGYTNSTDNTDKKIH